MKDPNDKATQDLPALAAGAGVAPQEQTRTAAKPFDRLNSVLDGQSFGQPRPKGAKPDLSGLHAVGRSFVPVAFVARDWNVTPRRIRHLLMAGRLYGRQQANGYWEVGYPYQYVFGTRGPSLKRQQRPAKHPRLVVDNTERRKE